ncbi:GNAT family N-acetyltransferase [Paenibacillus sp. NFR01]|uniref:GNAT family N-acetyltransferase n=1 Tax=Paenibacillus sp. NFR01 TaxID=1566279 RepID=UPI0008BB8D8F|nr:GNAT family N-acetyltransferase [Paenibacillus sp. NFR01]SET60456.1 GNAT acetyltransferase [Paenibacillus sp. NFR01]
MPILDRTSYELVRPLVTSRNELSVFAVLEGRIEGEVMVDSAEHPTAVLIRTSETNLLAGRTDNAVFNAAAFAELDFWDPATPDDEAWRAAIPSVHGNRFIREYTRHRYTLSRRQFTPAEHTLPEGYVLERIDLQHLRDKNYVNASRLLEWAAGWGNEEMYISAGCGSYIRHQDTIVSWSVADCSAGDRIAIGIHTDARYRKKGLAKQVVSAVVQDCFDKGFSVVEWSCVSSNAGSNALARALGFRLANTYPAFTSYAPIENVTDLDAAGWQDWGAYQEQAAAEEPRLYIESVYAYVKANDAGKVMELIQTMTRAGQTLDLADLDGAIKFFQCQGLCSAFTAPEWEQFMERAV